MGKFFIHDANNIVLAEGDCTDGDEQLQAQVVSEGQTFVLGPVDWTVFSRPKITYGMSLDQMAGLARSTVHGRKCALRDQGVEVEISGSLVRFDSDLAARSAYADLGRELAANPAFTVPDWRASAGQWVCMDADLLARVLAAGREALVQCYSWQRRQDEAIQQAVLDGDAALLERIIGGEWV